MVSRVDGGYQASAYNKLTTAPTAIAAPGKIALGGAPTGMSLAGTGPSQPIVQQATQQAAAPQMQPSGGAAAGGGSAPAAVATQAAARPSLSDYINSNFLYQQQNGAGNDAMANFDAQTLKGQQDTEATQALRGQELQQNQDQAGNANADNLAAHGLLNSGINFQNQDKINAQGVNQRSSIDNLLSDFISGRQQGRQSQDNANRQALNGVMNQLTQQFNQQNAATVA